MMRCEFDRLSNVGASDEDYRALAAYYECAAPCKTEMAIYNLHVDAWRAHFVRAWDRQDEAARMMLRVGRHIVRMREQMQSDAQAWRAERNRLCDMINVALRSRNDEA